MTIEIYGVALSPPCRLVYLTLDVLGIEYKAVYCHPHDGMHKTPDFLKLNPQHNIPVMVDGSLVMNESRAIATYLASMAGRYGGTSDLFPSDPKVRAVIDQRLYFDHGTFYKTMGDNLFPLTFPGYGIHPGENEVKRFHEVMGWIQDFVKPTGYIAGTNDLTVADLAFLATFSTIEATCHFDLSTYPDVNAWFAKVKNQVPNYEHACGKGATLFGDLFRKAMSK